MFIDRPMGIDLGTTNSEIALLDPSEREIIVYADRFGRRTMPSAVAWDPKDEVFLVGRAARARRGRTPAPVESIKRRMGQDHPVEIGPHSLSPEEVSAKILAELQARMQAFLTERAEGAEVRAHRAVITVPAYFDAPQIEATRRAGELAGLEVLGVLQEPTAAAIYHTFERQLGDGCFLVYDLGGGTFDVSILRCLGGEYQVLAIDGDNFLGGDDLDRRFAEHLRRRLVAAGYELELDPANDPEDRARHTALLHLAQEVKESLSTAEVVHLNKRDILTDKAAESVELEAEIGRAEWDAAVGDLIESSIACCKRALARSEEVAGVTLADIDHVVLVGGSTRVPLVVERVREALCAGSKSEEPLQDEVDACVALGAAIHAAQLGGLRVGDDIATVSILSPLVSQGATLELRLRLDQAPESARRVSIRADGQDLATEAWEHDTPEILTLRVPLDESAEQRVELVIATEVGEALTRLPIALYRGDVRPRASALSQPSVVAKDISVEVVRAGRRERKVILPRGKGLPAEVSHTFATADKSGAVVLRILQNRLPIKTLMIAIDPELPVGTPVSLSLRCDDAMRLEAKAEVAGQELWAKIEPAPQKIPNEAEIEAVLAKAEALGRSLWGDMANHFRVQAERLAAGIREVVGMDPAKTTALASELALLIERYGGADHGLTPLRENFEHTVDRIRRVIFAAGDKPTLGMQLEQWEARIEALVEKGDRAWEAADQGDWRRVNNEAQALLETLHEQKRTEERIDDATDVATALRYIGLGVAGLTEQLQDFVPSAADDVRALQLAERDRLLASLRERVEAPIDRARASFETANDPKAIRPALNAARVELNRIMIAADRLHSLGVVAEGSGG